MYLFASKAEVTQISLTGSRLIVILGALMVAPRDLLELNSLVTECGLVDKNYSKDTIRIALSTLKALGCEISRPCKANNYKYVLKTHPFVLDFTNDEVAALKTVYSNLSKQDDYKTAVTFDSLVRKLNSRIYNQDTVSRLLEITSFYKFEPGILEAIIKQANSHNTLELTYESPGKGKKIVQHKVIFGRLYLRTNKLYIDATDVETGKQLTFLAIRIKGLVEVEKSDKDVELNDCKVLYRLKNFSKVKLPRRHKVVSIDSNDVAIIEGTFVNDFFALQHILSLGAEATILEPISLREAIIAKLKEVRKIYE